MSVANTRLCCLKMINLSVQRAVNLKEKTYVSVCLVAEMVWLCQRFMNAILMIHLLTKGPTLWLLVFCRTLLHLQCSITPSFSYFIYFHGSNFPFKLIFQNERGKRKSTISGRFKVTQQVRLPTPRSRLTTNLQKCLSNANTLLCLFLSS